MKVQRIAETPFTLTNNPPSQKIARQDYSRISLLFLPATGGTAIVISTKAGIANASMAQLFGGSNGPPMLRLLASRERELCCTEWYGQCSSVLGVNLIVFEVFEEDHVLPTSQGGIILGNRGNGQIEAINQINADRADTLRRSIEAARMGASHAR